MNDSNATDAISRSAVLDRLKMLRRNYTLKAGYRDAMTDAIGEVRDALTIDAVPVVHARWMFHDPDQHGNRKPYCSHCHEYHLTSWSDYVRCKVCPNCGAKMDGEVDYA